MEDHHKKRDVVYNRPDYRDARWERAKKVRPALLVKDVCTVALAKVSGVFAHVIYLTSRSSYSLFAGCANCSFPH